MVETFQNWWKQPFSSEMDVPHWFLFFGLIIAISVLWGLSIRSLQKVTE